MKERTCSKCGVIHEGQGLSASVKNKLSICGDCYKVQEVSRKKRWRDDPVARMIEVNTNRRRRRSKSTSVSWVGP